MPGQEVRASPSYSSLCFSPVQILRSMRPPRGLTSGPSNRNYPFGHTCQSQPMTVSSPSAVRVSAPVVSIIELVVSEPSRCGRSKSVSSTTISMSVFPMCGDCHAALVQRVDLAPGRSTDRGGAPGCLEQPVPAEPLTPSDRAQHPRFVGVAALLEPPGADEVERVGDPALPEHETTAGHRSQADPAGNVVEDLDGDVTVTGALEAFSCRGSLTRQGQPTSTHLGDTVNVEVSRLVVAQHLESSDCSPGRS